VKFISLFVSHPCEIECPSSPLLEHKPCPSGHPNENFYATGIYEATLGTTKKNPIVEHESLFFETPQVSCSLSESPELILFSTECSYQDHHLLLILFHKLFKRVVVDAFVYTNITNPIVALWY